MDSSDNKTVLITGASSGIGAACAEAFAREGYRLILIARRSEQLREFQARVTPDVCLIGIVDVRDRDGVNGFIENLPEDFRKIDVLVNNAGLARGLAPVHEGEYCDWDEMINTNIKGLLNVTRAVIPGMVSRNTGHIINIGSIAGRHVYPNGTVYCATKYAVRALTLGIQMELVDTQVRISTVDPGLVDTEFSIVRHRGNAERASSTYKGLTPLHAEDVAETVLFCATRPPHVNVSEVVVLPTCQASPYHVHRQDEVD